MTTTLFYCSGCEAVIVPPVLQASVLLTEVLGFDHEPELVQIASVSTVGFTPVSVTVADVPQTFQIGAAGEILVLTALAAYQTIVYTVT